MNFLNTPPHDFSFRFAHPRYRVYEIKSRRDVLLYTTMLTGTQITKVQPLGFTDAEQLLR